MLSSALISPSLTLTNGAAFGGSGTLLGNLLNTSGIVKVGGEGTIGSLTINGEISIVILVPSVAGIGY